MNYKLLLLFALTLLTGCSETPMLWRALQGGNVRTDSLPSNHIAIEGDANTVYGDCLEGSSVDTLCLLTDDGRTLTLDLQRNDSTETSLLGGINEGDRLALQLETDSAEHLVLVRSINLTTLSGTWKDHERTLWISEGGNLKMKTKTPPHYNGWEVVDGHLILFQSKGQTFLADTFAIQSLQSAELILRSTSSSLPASVWSLHR